MKKQKILYFSDSQWDKIQKFKATFMISSDAKAIYELIDKGLLVDQQLEPMVCHEHYSLTEEYSVGPKERCFRCLIEKK